MNTTVAALLGRNPKKGDLGMELEVEALGMPPAINEKKWRCKPDGSLRIQGVEFYSSEPVSIDGLYERIKYLTDKLLDPQVQVIKDSPRTSFHVHHNVMNLTLTQAWTVICAWYLLENLLVRWCDGGSRTREGNCFCLRLCDADLVSQRIIQDLQKETPFKDLCDDRIRYTALNLKAIKQFGSLEVRSMRGEIDPNLLYTWAVEVSGLINKAAREFKDPGDLLDSHHYKGSKHILDTLLGQDFIRALIRETPNWDEEMRESAALISEFAYFHDWSRWQKKMDSLHDKVIPKDTVRPLVNADINQLQWDNVPELEDVPRPGRWRVCSEDLAQLFRAAGKPVRYNDLNMSWEYFQ